MYGKFVKKLEEMPSCEHWVILRESSYSTPASHGYQATTNGYLEYEAFLNKEQFEAELKRRIAMYDRYCYGGTPIGIHVAGVVRSSTEVRLEESK
jgi:hypothetical protein